MSASQSQSPEAEAQAHVDAIMTLTRVFEAFHQITMGRLVVDATPAALDATLNTLVDEGAAALKMLPDVDRMDFLENAVLSTTALFARFGREHVALLREMRSARESPTQPDAAQPLEPAREAASHPVHPGG